jgi:Holliday junction resolvasome RuvABC endonuclease subunit
MYLDEMAPKVLVYEEVAAHKGTAAAQIYGGLISTIQTYCEQHNVPYLGIPVGTVKKAATGRGNASKDEMHAAAVLKLGMAVRGTEDEADALWILHTWLAGVPRSE